MYFLSSALYRNFEKSILQWSAFAEIVIFCRIVSNSRKKPENFRVFGGEWGENSHFSRKMHFSEKFLYFSPKYLEFSLKNLKNFEFLGGKIGLFQRKNVFWQGRSTETWKSAITVERTCGNRDTLLHFSEKI